MTTNSRLPDRDPSPSQTEADTEPEEDPCLTLSRWHDPVIDQLGFDPRSRYVERFWLSTLGPSTVFLLRLSADLLDASDEPVEVELEELAIRLGIGYQGGRNSALRRTLNRACRFGAARFAGREEIQMRFRMAPINRGHVERLPEALQTEHDRWLSRGTDSSAHERGRARRLALSLIECGDGYAETERQLIGWQVSDSAAMEAVNWAWERHCRAADSLGLPINPED